MCKKFEETDLFYMNLALCEARQAAKEGETPVGALVVREGRVLAAAHNRREALRDIGAHAEMLALSAAAKETGDWRLSGCTLYVTMEPCPMCAGALLAARVSRVVYGAPDAVAGAMGSVVNLPRFPLGAHPVVEGGLLAEASRALLRDFFVRKREEKKNRPEKQKKRFRYLSYPKRLCFMFCSILKKKQMSIVFLKKIPKRFCG